MKEELILDYLIGSEQYCRQVLPFLKDEYFQDQSSRTIYQIIDKHYKEYNTLATRDVIDVELNSHGKLNEQQFKLCKEILDGLKNSNDIDIKWAVSRTEKFCQDRAVYNAIMESIKIFDGKEKTDLSRSGIPKLLQDALAIQINLEGAILGFAVDVLAKGSPRRKFVNFVLW